MSFAVGDEAWLVVQGDTKQGAGKHPVTIKEVDAAKGEVVVSRQAWVDPELVFDFCPNGWSYPAGEWRLPANEKMSEKAVVDDEGDGHAAVYRKDPKFPEGGVWDMVDMSQLNDAELARNLQVKFKDDRGWVTCGPTLVAMNLMKGYKVDWSFNKGAEWTNAYPTDKSLLEKFRDQKSREDSMPHAWSLASHAYRQLFNDLNPAAGHKYHEQALIVTGESGAGKTWNTKVILDFLAYVGESELTNKMLSTTPILEGFGNANMPRNPDSSRFGKLYRVYFRTDTQKLTGCSVTPYMLEKSRVSTQQRNERNFHIFYRMLCPPRDVYEIEKVKHEQGEKREEKAADALQEVGTIASDAVSRAGEKTWWEEGGKKVFGLPQAKKDMCKLGKFEDYIYLAGGTNTVASEPLDTGYKRIYGDIPAGWGPDGEGTQPEASARVYDDAMHMSHTLAALHGFFTEEQVDTILKVTAGVLHLGNVDCDGDKDDPPKGILQDATSQTAFANVCELWQIDPELLTACITKRTIDIGRGKIQQVSTKSRDTAIIQRDTVARFVYNKLFEFIVAQCSQTLKKDVDELSAPGGRGDVFLGVLDIFGFEFYENDDLMPYQLKVVNGLDQLNINICNEMLQQVFVGVIFTLEEGIYNTQKVGHLVDFESFDEVNNEPAVNFLTEKSGPLLKAMTQSQQKPAGPDRDKPIIQYLTKSGGKTFESDKARNRFGKQVFVDYSKLRGMKPFPTGPYGRLNKTDPNNPKKKIDHSKEVINGKEDELNNIDMCPAFGIRHYAAEVAYDVRGFSLKDMAKPAPEMETCMAASKDLFFMAPEFSKDEIASGGVTEQFVGSLQELIATLSKTDMSFVRCLKASNPPAPKKFQAALVLKQLKYTGMLDTLKIRRFGYPTRMSHGDFVFGMKSIYKGSSTLGTPLPDDPNREEVDKQNAIELADFCQKNYAAEIFGTLPPADQNDPALMPQKDAAICVGQPSDPKTTGPMVMMRDWFYRGLDARVQIEMKVHYDNCRPLAQSAVYQHIQCAFGDDVQNGVNGLGTKLGYSVIRETMTKLVPEMKNFLHRATAASVSEVQALENDKIGTLEFLEKNKAIQEREKKERALFKAEDDLSMQLAFARAVARFGSDKAMYREEGEQAYQKFKALESQLGQIHADADAVLGEASAMSADDELRESSAKFVLAPPLVRAPPAPNRKTKRFVFKLKPIRTY